MQRAGGRTADLGRAAARAAVAALVASCSVLTPAPRAIPAANRPVAELPLQVPHSAADSLRVAPAPSDTLPTPRPVQKDSTIDVTPTEVVGEATRVFGPLPPKAVVDSASGGPVWDMDVRSYEGHDRVEHYVRIFSGSAKAPFEKSLQRQSYYAPLINAKLRAAGLPEDLTYLALIESWYDPQAYSSAAAVGMWQFMSRTARDVGLRVDWWIDERRDPVRSTEGAVRMLRGLRDQFGGSLYLAAAAYNGGDGRVSRGLALHRSDMAGIVGEDRFFALSEYNYLRPQTRDYVPKLIAAALVGKEPARYGVRFDSVAPFAFDSVRVGGSVPVAAVAAVTGATLLQMRALNPHVLRGMTPPGESMWIRVPAGSSANFDEKFDALEPNERSALSRVESKKGESMSSIAKKHGFSAKQLAWYNPKVTRLRSGNLAAGQRLLIPTKQTVSAAFDVPDPSIEKYPRHRKASAKKTSAKKSSAKRSSVSKASAKKSTAKAPAKKKTPAKKPTSAKKLAAKP
jgi:membrane-bound lytic murein transglycosylase D